MQQRTRSFPLRKGYCVIYPDRIQIEGKDISHRIIQLLYKWGITRALLFYTLLTFVFVGALFFFIWLNNYFLALFFLGASLFTIYLMWQNRALSFAPVIIRKEIDYIYYYPTIPGERRASFTIFYTPGKKRLKRRLILPTQKGDMIAQSAYIMMKDAGEIREG